MGYDILLLMPCANDFANIRDTLTSSGIDVSHPQNTESMKAGLASHSPAFILLDFNVEDAEVLLHEISKGVLRPCPFVIVSANFANSTERADMLVSANDKM